MDDEDELPVGETVEYEDVDDDVEDTADGGAIVRLGDDDEETDSTFGENLAETLPEHELQTLATTFIDLIGKDKEARKRRDEQYEEGLRRTGLGEDAPGGAQFEGASKVVHPMLTEACVDFAARAMKEIFPPSGPAKDYVVGKATAAKVRKAKRKTTLLNWQMTVQAQEFRSELEQLMTQLPLGGAQYLKITWDMRRNRPAFMFVAIDDMLLPYAATNFYTAQRKTHVQYLTQLDYEKRVRDGMYRDVDLVPASMEPEQSLAGQANDKIEGREANSYNEDGLRIVYEVYTTATIEDDEEAPAPYILSIDKVSGKVLSIYRNWDEDDETREEQYWFTEWPFIPWRGAYPIGLPHMIGGLSGAATGALRALLDSAHISNSQTMLKLKGGTSGGQSISIQPTEVVEIEGGLNVDDVRKLAMPLPYNPPSPVLFSLLGFLVEAGKGVVRTSMEDIADNNPNAPVGTTLAKLEQGAVVYSSIHARLHDAMARTLRVLHRLNAMYLDDEDLEHEAGEELATREDFNGPLDVVPVSDPNIFSEAQRYAQIQAVAQRAAGSPLYDQRKVEERLLETLKIPNAKDLLAPALTPSEQNAVNENVTASLGRPITAFPEQDHIAHLQTHLSYMVNPLFGGNPIIAPAFLPAVLNHIKEHLALWYASQVFAIASEATGRDLGEMMREMAEEDHNPSERQALDRMLAVASAATLQGAAQEQLFAQLPPIIQQAQQMLQAMQPQQMQDPRLQLEGQKLQIAQQKEQREAAGDQADAQIKQQELQLEAQRQQADQQTDAQKLMAAVQQWQAEMQQKAEAEVREDARLAAELQAKMAMNSADNATALQLAAAEIATGDRIAVENGTGINPNPMDQ